MKKNCEEASLTKIPLSDEANLYGDVASNGLDEKR
jgi:hypothetical protein